MSTMSSSWSNFKEEKSWQHNNEFIRVRATRKTSCKDDVRWCATTPNIAKMVTIKVGYAKYLQRLTIFAVIPHASLFIVFGVEPQNRVIYTENLAYYVSKITNCRYNLLSVYLLK